MTYEKSTKADGAKGGTKKKKKQDPGLLFQEYLGASSSPEEALFKINEFLHAGKFEDTRKNVRAPLTVPVAFKVDDKTRVGTSYTLSQNGMFIKCPYPPPIKTKVQVDIQLPDQSEFIQAEAEVVQSIPLEEAARKASLSGMAVVFTKIRQEDSRKIDRVVKAYARRMGKPKK